MSKPKISFFKSKEGEDKNIPSLLKTKDEEPKTPGCEVTTFKYEDRPSETLDVEDEVSGPETGGERGPKYQKTKSTTLLYLLQSKTLYSIPLNGGPPVVLSDLDIPVFAGKTVRADYILKFQTSNAAWACSLGFLGVQKETDNLMGTAHWTMSKAGSTSTTYSFMTSDPRFYSNNSNKSGIADSNVPFAGLNDSSTFNSVKVNVEYFNGSNKTSTLSIEFHRDLYLYNNQIVQMIPGSSVEYRFY